MAEDRRQGLWCAIEAIELTDHRPQPLLAGKLPERGNSLFTGQPGWSSAG